MFQTINPQMPTLLTNKEITRLTLEYKQRLEAFANSGAQPVPYFPFPVAPPPFMMPPTQFMPPIGQPDYYAEFLRQQQLHQREQELIRQQQILAEMQQQMQNRPSPSFTSGNARSSVFNESNFSPLTVDFLNELDSNIPSTSTEEPIRASSSFFDAVANSSNIDDQSGHFLSLFSSENNHIWEPIADEDVTKESLWPNLNDARKKEE
jgi:hypothetical protein